MTAPTGARRRSLLGEEGGNAVVEFALLALPLVVIIVGFFELGRFFFLNESLANAAREGARAAAVRGAASPDPATPDDIRAIVRNHVPGFVPADRVEVETTFTPNNNPGGRAEIAVGYSYRLLVPWVADFTMVNIEKHAALTISR